MSDVIGLRIVMPVGTLDMDLSLPEVQPLIDRGLIEPVLDADEADTYCLALESQWSGADVELLLRNMVE